MEKTKLLTFAVITLLLLNLGTLGFLFFSGPKGNHPHPGQGQEGRPKPREIIIEKLHFDANQQKEYDKLIQWHQSEIRTIEDTIRAAKNELYSTLSASEVNKNEKDSLINALAIHQKQIETTHFKHFEDIKKLCHKDQLEDFDNLTDELSRIFSKGQRPPGPRHE
jgi:protein CpxP